MQHFSKQAHLKEASQKSSQNELKKQIASIMSVFEEAIEGYSTNRKDLDHMLNQLLKAYRTLKIYKHQNRTISSNTSKEDIYFEFCLLNNISCCYNTKKQISKACQFMKLADKELKWIVEELQKSELDYQSRKLETISLHMRMVRVKLQLCGIYALNIQHVESLHESSQAFGFLESVIHSICDYSMGEKFHEDFLELQKCVADPNTEISEKEIKNTYWNNIMNCQSDEEVVNIFFLIFKNFHSKEQTQARSCLGKIIANKQEKADTISADSKKYLKEFSIGSIMKISPIMIQDFHPALTKDHFLTLKFLHQLTILLSLTHFTVSTQLRLGSMYDLDSATIESLSAEDQLGMIKKEKRIIQAERHHFFALEIIYKLATPYTRNCPFFHRLIKGYEEVYLLKDNFEIIPEKVEEENQISLISTKQKHPNKYDYREHEEYYLKKMRDSKCETPRSLAKRQLRADLYRIRKKQEEEHKLSSVKMTRKTPSTNKNHGQLLSPRMGKIVNKSKEKDSKITKIKGKGVERMVSPGMRTSKYEYGQ